MNNYKFLISKIMYNLYDYPKYPKIIRIMYSNKNYTKFTYTYRINNCIYKNEIDIENLFKYFNVLKPELVISLKKIDNKLLLIINRYKGEDEDIYKDIGYIIDLIQTKNKNQCYSKYIEYVFIDIDKSIRFENSQTIKTQYIYYNDDIKTILNNFITDREIIECIFISIYEFIGKLLHLFTIDNENAIKNILYLNQDGQQFLLFITNKIIDFSSIRIIVYDYRFNIKNFVLSHKDMSVVLIKYKEIIYVISFKEKKVLERNEEESGLNKDELQIFLKSKV